MTKEDASTTNRIGWIEEDRRRTGTSKSLIMFAISWDLLIVLLSMPFAPPLQGITSALGLPDSMAQFFYLYESMLFHALAVPFVAVLLYVTLSIFEVRGKVRAIVETTATAGFILASLSSMFIVLNGGSSLAFALLWVGLSLSILSGLGLVVAMWPRKDAGSCVKLKGRNLLTLCLWASVISVLAAVAVGAFASTGSTQWGAASSFKAFRLVVASHTHVVITLIDVALVVLIARHFRVDAYQGIPGLFVRIGLYGILIGIPTTTAATFATVPLGVAAHNAITVFACILLQASLFIMYAIMATEGRKIKIAGVFKNIMTFGLLFIIFWVNVVVTLPGIYVAVNMRTFVGLPNEVAFITGHMHVLITLTAVALVMLVAHMYGVKGKMGLIGGSALTCGYVLSSAGTVPYMFLDWNPVSSIYIPYISGGITLMVVGMLTILASLVITRGLPRGAAVDNND